MSMFRGKRGEVEERLVSVDPPEQQPDETPRPRPTMRLNLARGADGRLRKADDTDIGDLWAEQQRVRLHEAIAEDRRQAAKKQKRAENGWLGLKKAKRALPKVTTNTITTQPPHTITENKKQHQATPREVTVSLSVPKIRLPKFTVPNFIRTRKKLAIFSGLAIVLLVASFALYPEPEQKEQQSGGGPKVASESVSNIPTNQTPKFDTLLPRGKSIEELGGWARVSPPNAAPVFAYDDTIQDVKILVSQQQLPDNFKKDTAGAIENLAIQFSAKEKLAVSDAVAYVGTSAKGPQSVVIGKDGLLILIRSDKKIANDKWAGYIASLR